MPSDQPDGSFKVVLPREKGHKYTVEHRDGLFYIRTNKGAKNFRLVTAPVANPSPQNWKEILPRRGRVLLQNVELFKDHLVVARKIGGARSFPGLRFRHGQRGTTSSSRKASTPRHSEPDARVRFADVPLQLSRA